MAFVRVSPRRSARSVFGAGLSWSGGVLRESGDVGDSTGGDSRPTFRVVSEGGIGGLCIRCGLRQECDEEERGSCRGDQDKRDHEDQHPWRDLAIPDTCNPPHPGSPCRGCVSALLG